MRCRRRRLRRQRKRRWTKAIERAIAQAERLASLDATNATRHMVRADLLRSVLDGLVHYTPLWIRPPAIDGELGRLIERLRHSEVSWLMTQPWMNIKLARA